MFDRSPQQSDQMAEEGDEIDDQKVKAIEKEAKKILNRLDYSKEQNRIALAKSYRKLNKVLTSRFDSNYFLSDRLDLIDVTAQYAHKVRPFVMGNDLRFLSSICKEDITANRRCSLPSIIIDGEMIDFEGKLQKMIAKDVDFQLIIDSEPNTHIIFTRQPVHPLLATDRQVRFQKVNQQFKPPIELNIVVVKDPYKISSQMLSLRVKYNKTQNQNRNGLSYIYGVQRPHQESSNLEDSGMSNSMSRMESYIKFESD